jgi:hypothetical protein
MAVPRRLEGQLLQVRQRGEPFIVKFVKKEWRNPRGETSVAYAHFRPASRQCAAVLAWLYRCPLLGASLPFADGKFKANGVSMTVIVFDDGESDYQRWLGDHRRGYVINISRGYKRPDEARLHCAECDSISDSTKPYVTGDYVKVCADRRNELDEWAIEELGTKVLTCGQCFSF